MIIKFDGLYVCILSVILNYCSILWSNTILNKQKRQQSSLNEIYCVIFMTWKANRVERRFHVLCLHSMSNEKICNVVRCFFFLFLSQSISLVGRSSSFHILVHNRIAHTNQFDQMNQTEWRKKMLMRINCMHKHKRCC